MKSKVFLFIIMAFSLCFPVYAELSAPEYEKYIKEIPVYPDARIYDMSERLKFRLKVHLSDSEFSKVTKFYIRQMLKKGWKIEFPNETELKIWMEALERTKNEKPNIMLHLTKPNTNVNCNITIGSVSEARSVNNLTIITIYLTDTMLK